MTDFWVRRKAAVAAEDVAATREHIETEARDKTDAELLDELELPDPDKLNADGDFAAFMSKTIPARLRNRALRRLWQVNPALANLDGLLDYGEDFTDSATVIENLQTAYQVGKGMLAHIEEMARQAEAVEEEDQNVEPVEKTPEPEVLTVVAEVEAPEFAHAAEEPMDDHAPATTSRRMQFNFVSEDAV